MIFYIFRLKNLHSFYILHFSSFTCFTVDILYILPFNLSRLYSKPLFHCSASFSSLPASPFFNATLEDVPEISSSFDGVWTVLYRDNSKAQVTFAPYTSKTIKTTAVVHLAYSNDNEYFPKDQGWYRLICCHQVPYLTLFLIMMMGGVLFHMQRKREAHPLCPLHVYWIATQTLSSDSLGKGQIYWTMTFFNYRKEGFFEKKFI